MFKHCLGGYKGQYNFMYYGASIIRPNHVSQQAMFLKKSVRGVGNFHPHALNYGWSLSVNYKQVVVGCRLDF